MEACFKGKLSEAGPYFVCLRLPATIVSEVPTIFADVAAEFADLSVVSADFAESVVAGGPGSIGFQIADGALVTADIASIPVLVVPAVLSRGGCGESHCHHRNSNKP